MVTDPIYQQLLYTKKTLRLDFHHIKGYLSRTSNQGQGKGWYQNLHELLDIPFFLGFLGFYSILPRATYFDRLGYSIQQQKRPPCTKNIVKNSGQLAKQTIRHRVDIRMLGDMS